MSEGTKLPLQLSTRLQSNLNVVSAYGFCLNYEKELEEEKQVASGKDLKDVGRNLIYCRIIGYLLHHYPTDEALRTVVYEVVSCQNREDFLAVGQKYYDHFIRPFRSNKEPIPIPSSHASRPSFDNLADMIKKVMDQAPQSHAAAKKMALVRDRFRCVVTGVYEHTAVNEYQELMEEVNVNNARVLHTECAHIFDESINDNIESNSIKKEYASNVWAVMRRFGYKKLPEELNGPMIHRLENVMTLHVDVHKYFDELLLWFVQTEEPHKYKIKTRYSYTRTGLPDYVTFRTPDEEKLPRPSPTYLKLHAACCEVAHLSGAAEYIEKFYRDMEDTQVLSNDGSAAKLLEEALLHSSSRLVMT